MSERMRFFTLVLDYDGGTYVSQVKCRSIDRIPLKLAEGIDWGLLGSNVSARMRQRYLTRVSDDPPAPLNGLRGVWCISGMLGRKLALIHVVETASELQPRRAPPSHRA